jgi:hypothetical protein
MYAILSKSRKMCLPVDIQIQLFDVMVMPILLYGSEVWGYENIDSVERVHKKFLKHLLYLNSSTTTCMVYRETGCYPMKVYINTRVIGFWGRLLTGPPNKFSVLMYKIMRKLDVDSPNSFLWLKNVKVILNNCGLSNIWESENFPSLDWLKNCTLQRNKDQFNQTWSVQTEESNKCINYRIFKNTFLMEPYLLSLPNKLRITFSKFRCRNTRLPIEVGAHLNIPRSERLCIMCDLNEVGDEFHYLFNCSMFGEHRKLYIKKYYWNKPSAQKMTELLNSKNRKLTNLCKFISLILAHFNQNSKPKK